MNHVNTGNNRFCGPAVLSIITGKSVDECASLFAQHKGVRNVTSITYADLHAILEKLRYKFTDIDSDLSLYSCMVSVASKPGFYIIGLPKHVAALEVVSSKEIYYCDNQTREPIRGSSSARMGQRVDHLIRVELKPEPVLIGKEVEVLSTPSYYGSKDIRFTLQRKTIYENPEDNQVVGLGTFYLTSKDEILQVIEGLTKYANELS